MKVLTIWRLLDGKPGHESQTLGLANAMVRLGKEQDVNVQVYDIPIRRSDFGPVAWLLRRCVIGKGLPAPDLIMAAGSATHWALLCVRRAYGGRAVVLMRPSLPLSWFDWVVAPQHDGVSGPNVISTLGALNPMQPGIKKLGSVLVLLGGPSKHFSWAHEHVMAQVDAIMSAFPKAIITDSRRTPEAFRQALVRRYSESCHLFNHCPSGWLAEELATIESVWVSEDSVSMIYESLTAGCAVGLIGLQRSEQKLGRLVRGVDTLAYEGKVVSFVDWEAGKQLCPPNPVFREANCVAKRLLCVLSKP